MTKLKIIFNLLLFIMSLSILAVGCAKSSEFNLNIGKIKKYNVKYDYYENNHNLNIIDQIVSEEGDEVIVYDCLYQRDEQKGLVSINIQYPQIRFMNENDTPSDVVQDINRQIFEYVICPSDITWHDSRYNCSISYTINYVNSDYFSIIFEGEHVSVPSALNFNLKTGKLVNLNDLISGDELWQLISKNPEVIIEDKWISIVGGREGILEYLSEYLQENEHYYDYAITEDGFKFIIFNEIDNKMYYIANIKF